MAYGQKQRMQSLCPACMNYIILSSQHKSFPLIAHQSENGITDMVQKSLTIMYTFSEPFCTALVDFLWQLTFYAFFDLTLYNLLFLKTFSNHCFATA